MSGKTKRFLRSIFRYTGAVTALPSWATVHVKATVRAPWLAGCDRECSRDGKHETVGCRARGVHRNVPMRSKEMVRASKSRQDSWSGVRRRSSVHKARGRSRRLPLSSSPYDFDSPLSMPCSHLTPFVPLKARESYPYWVDKDRLRSGPT